MHITRGPISSFMFLIVLVKAKNIKEVAVDIGQNLTLECPDNFSQDVMWIREDKKDENFQIITALKNGSLFLSHVNKNDSGIYICKGENTSDIKARIKVKVHTTPPALINVSVKASTILALILWQVQGNGGYPIKNFTAQYRLGFTDNEWIPISPNHITPNSRQLEVYKLLPNTTYEFRIWATNRLGSGDITNVLETTLCDYREEELARHIFQGCERFNTRAWAIAVGVVMTTLVILASGTCILLYREWRVFEEETKI